MLRAESAGERCRCAVGECTRDGISSLRKPGARIARQDEVGTEAHAREQVRQLCRRRFRPQTACDRGVRTIAEPIQLLRQRLAVSGVTVIVRVRSQELLQCSVATDERVIRLHIRWLVDQSADLRLLRRIDRIEVEDQDLTTLLVRVAARRCDARERLQLVIGEEQLRDCRPVLHPGPANVGATNARSAPGSVSRKAARSICARSTWN